MLKQKFIQASCVEGKKVDMRQANIIKKYKPDMVFFELPAALGNPSLIFNKYSVKNKPLSKTREIKKVLTRNSKKYPYALSDVFVWNSIEELWSNGKNTLLFNVDSPKELRSHDFEKYGAIPYSRATKQWRFWVFLYIREYYMSENIRKVLEKYKGIEKPVIAVFLQSVHWNHVKFLLKNPSKKDVWKFYFGRFPKLTSLNINEKLKEEDRIYYKYWKKTNLGRGII